MAYDDSRRRRRAASPSRDAQANRRSQRFAQDRTQGQTRGPSRGADRGSVRSPAQAARAYRRQRTTGRARTTRPRRRSSLLPRLVAAAVVIVLGVVLALRIRSCQQTPRTSGSAETPATTAVNPTSPYDWSCLSWDDGRVTYVQGGTTRSRTGIDVSEHQEWIDWQAVAADGIDFAMVRVGYRSSNSGTIFSDNYADYNLRTASEVGLDLGVYFYSQAVGVEEAREEAEFVLDKLGDIRPTYPVVFDLEPGNIAGERIEGMTNEERTQAAIAFCERIEEAGLTAMIYGNATEFESLDVNALGGRGLWYAEYASQPSTDLPITLWQYSESGSVSGVDTPVDLNLDLSGALGAGGGEAA